MPGASVTETHDRVFVVVVNSVCIRAVSGVVGRGRIVAEVHLSFHFAVLTLNQLKAVVVYIVYNERRRAREVPVSPCVCENVHRDTCRLLAFAFGEADGFLDQLAVRVADKPVFVKVFL